MFGIGFTKPLKNKIAQLQETNLRIFSNANREVGALREVKESLLNKDLEITRLAAENAVLKQRVINLESELKEGKNFIQDLDARPRTIPDWATNHQIVNTNQELPVYPANYRLPDETGDNKHAALKGCATFPETQNKQIHPNLQAYYNRGKKRVIFNEGKVEVDKKTGEKMKSFISKQKPLKPKQKSTKKKK